MAERLRQYPVGWFGQGCPGKNRDDQPPTAKGLPGKSPCTFRCGEPEDRGCDPSQHALKKFSKAHHSSLNELNITPLLDLAFVLLVIFIITTPQLSNDLEMNLPSPKKNSAPSPPPKINRIMVDAAGHITLNEQAIELAALKPALIDMKSRDPETSVVVRGASDVDYQRVVGVLDALQQAEITKVGLATETVQ